MEIQEIFLIQYLENEKDLEINFRFCSEYELFFQMHQFSSSCHCLHLYLKSVKHALQNHVFERLSSLFLLFLILYNKGMNVQNLRLGLLFLGTIRKIQKLSL